MSGLRVRGICGNRMVLSLDSGVEAEDKEALQDNTAALESTKERVEASVPGEV